MTKSVFSQFWKLEDQYQGANRIGFWWDLFSWLADNCLPAVSSHNLFSVCMHSWYLFLFLWGHGSYCMGVLPSWPQFTLIISLEALSLVPSHWGEGFKIWILGRYNSVQISKISSYPATSPPSQLSEQLLCARYVVILWKKINHKKRNSQSSRKRTSKCCNLFNFLEKELSFSNDVPKMLLYPTYHRNSPLFPSLFSFFFSHLFTLNSSAPRISCSYFSAIFCDIIHLIFPD